MGLLIVCLDRLLWIVRIVCFGVCRLCMMILVNGVNIVLSFLVMCCICLISEVCFDGCGVLFVFMCGFGELGCLLFLIV